VPIGLVSDDLLREELERLNPKKKESHPKVIDINSPGRKEGDVNVPDSLRAIIGEEALLNGRQAALNLAKDFGISPSSVSAYSKGATSTTTYDTPSRSIISHINKSRQRAVKRAQRTLNSALEAITQDKLDYADPKDLASIAKDMTVVIKNLEPQQAESKDAATAPQFVIFAPQFRDERSFETITVSE
jgi:hypothetical protein